jgi:ferredoxin
LFPGVKNIAKLTRIPLLGKLFDKLLFEGDNIIYLPQDRIIAVNQVISQQEDLVLPSSVLEYFIKRANYHWIMNFCICRASMKCQNYPIDLGCLFLGEAVLGINPELGRLVSKEEALDHIKKCSEAGLVHMIGRNRLDKQWLGVNPGNKLLSICNCDPCCCLWRITPILNPKIGKKVQRMPGIEVYVTDKCIGCGTCTKDICFVNAITIVNNRAQIGKECRACGRCVIICPQGAIKLDITDKEFIEKSIKQIDQIIDVS